MYDKEDLEIHIQGIMACVKENGKELPEDCLDDLVHDTASGLASAANNGGLEEQVKFILSNGGTVEEVFETIRGALKNNNQ